MWVGDLTVDLSCMNRHQVAVSQAVPKVRLNHIIGFIGFKAQSFIIIKRFK